LAQLLWICRAGSAAGAHENCPQGGAAVAGLGTRVLPAAKVTPKNLLTCSTGRSSPMWWPRRGPRDRALRVRHRPRPGRESRIIRPRLRLEAQLGKQGQGRPDPWPTSAPTCPSPDENEFRAPDGAAGARHAVWCARTSSGDETVRGDAARHADAGEPADIGAGRPPRTRPSAAHHRGRTPPRGRRAQIRHCLPAETAPGFDGRLRGWSAWSRSPRRKPSRRTCFISGRYILQPEIFGLLSDQQAGAGGEIQSPTPIGAADEAQDSRPDLRRHDLDAATRSACCAPTWRFALANPEFRR